MAKDNKILKEKPPLPKRAKCGDCFYNGWCEIKLSKCDYLKKIVVEVEDIINDNTNTKENNTEEWEKN